MSCLLQLIKIFLEPQLLLVQSHDHLLVVLIGVQAFVAAQVGMRTGARLGDEAREWAERVAGILLVAAGVLVVVERQVGL